MTKYHRGPSFYDAVCTRYAKVLQHLPKKIQSFVLKESEEFLAWAQSEHIWPLILSLPINNQHEAIKQFFDVHSCHEPTVHFLCMVAEYKRLDALPRILELTQILLERTTHERVYIQFAEDLSQKDLGLIEKDLHQRLNKTIIPEWSRDPALLAGGIVIWQSYMIDASLLGIMNRLKKGLYDDIYAS